MERHPSPQPRTIDPQLSTIPRKLNPSPRTIIMVRHGETQGNLDDIAQGHFDAPLTEVGECQAEALANRLTGVEFNAVYSSDLERTSYTAEAIVGARPNLDIQTRPELRETHHGQYENTRWRTIREKDPEFYARWINWDTRIDAKFPGGESASDVRLRVGNAADEILTKHHENNSILSIVGHTGSLRALFGHLLNLPTNDQCRFDFDNASVTVIKEDVLAPNGWVAHSFNNTHHLNGFNPHG